MTKETESNAEPREPTKRKPPYRPGQRFEFKQYQKVICNGYPGTVTQVHQGKLKGMVDVRVPGGPVCVSSSYPDCYPEPALSAWTVLYGEYHLIFECQAEDIAHAIAKCENAHPGEVIVSAAENTSTALGHESPSSAQEKVQVLLRELEAALQSLRQLSDDPRTLC